MADILKVTQPLKGYDTAPKGVTNTPVNSGSIQNIVNPEKVVRPDQKEDYEQKHFNLSYESNFGSFLQAIRDNPALIHTFTQLIFTNMENVVSSGIQENFAEEIAKFMEMVQISGGDLLSFLKNQGAATEKFQGVFYQMLHQILDSTQSLDLKSSILDFVKRTNDMSSGEHILNNIQGNLSKILQYIMPEQGRELQDMIAKMAFAKEGDTEQNAAVLKNDIIPFLSQYIGKTHDFGKIRDLITLLTLNTARYENGNAEGVLQSFTKLLKFNEFRARIEGINPDNLMAILDRVNQENQNAQTGWMSQLMHMMNRALDGEGGYENKAVFQNMMMAMLLNESVYMPLMHIMLPINYEGALMFSEVWIDPDAENEDAEKEDEHVRTIKGLIKFDIKDVGFFDLLFQYREEMVDVQLFYPEKLVSQEKEIENKLAGIISENGLSVKNLKLEKCVKSKMLTEVFPKIYERKNSVNVRV